MKKRVPGGRLAVLRRGATALLLSLGVAGAEPPQEWRGGEFANGETGGRWGRVVWVTNLRDAGEGSLRAALATGGERTVLFRVGGEIELRSPLVIDLPQVTVDARRAPGDGIRLRGGPLVVAAPEVILRGLHGVPAGTADRPWRGGLAPVDSDFDGMPDAWERCHGLNPHDPADGLRDADGDGRSNLEAYLAGVAPRGPEAPPTPDPASSRFAVLAPADFARHVEYFNRFDPERVVNLVPNARSWDWMQAQVPFFTCPDADLEEIYFFRWWALRKHLKEVGDFRVYTEFIELETTAWFIPPERTIASALGLHFAETRWLQDQSDDDSYLDYWMVGKDGGPQGHFHRYSSWLHHALWQRALVTGDFAFLEARFDRLVADYARWEEEQQREDGLFWQYDVWDAMEESISGSRKVRNIRPTINAYMYANAVALATMAERFGHAEEAKRFRGKAEALREKTLAALWNPDSEFFEVRRPEGAFAGAREAIGFIPWMFHLPPPGQGYEVAWAQLTDPMGFWAPYGLTTAERRHPEFRSKGVGTCEWDGAVWPYATSQTLEALANVLRDDPGAPVTARDYYDAFLTYTRAQRFGDEPYIGEYQDENTGYWLKGRHPRSAFYHHSTYADLLLTGLLGLRPREDRVVEVDPLLPEGTWDWFCLDGVPYRGHQLTLLWDADGSRFGRGAGFQLLIDGQPAAWSPNLSRLEALLP
jgi:hypothetical protein